MLRRGPLFATRPPFVTLACSPCRAGWGVVLGLGLGLAIGWPAGVTAAQEAGRAPWLPDGALAVPGPGIAARDGSSDAATATGAGVAPRADDGLRLADGGASSHGGTAAEGAAPPAEEGEEASPFATLRALAERLSDGATDEAGSMIETGAPGQTILLTLALGMLTVAAVSAALLLRQRTPRRRAGGGQGLPGPAGMVQDGAPIAARGYTDEDFVAAAAVLRRRATLHQARRLPASPLFSAAAEIARARRAAGFGPLAERSERGFGVGAGRVRRAGGQGAGMAASDADPLASVASVAEELAASVAGISRRMAESTRIAEEAMAEASRTGVTVQSLADTAQRIGDAVRLIRQIDHQANALALSATLRAARAGEAAPGTKQVAEGMRGLAAQAARATARSQKEVRAAAAEARHVAGAVTAMEEVIGELSRIAAGIDAAVHQQRAATRQMVRAMRNAAGSSLSTSAAGMDVNAVLDAAARVEAAASELCRYVETTRSQIADVEAAMKVA